MCCLRGDRRPGDYGEPAINEIGPDSKHERWEKEVDMEKTFSPRRYNMIFCPVCKGKGKLPVNPRSLDVCGNYVCRNCTGFGLVKRDWKNTLIPLES